MSKAQRGVFDFDGLIFYDKVIIAKKHVLRRPHAVSDVLRHLARWNLL